MLKILNQLLQKAPSYIGTINNNEFILDGKKTLLESALSAGIEIPYNCRVGSCKKCLCYLKKGEIRSLVDLSYVLSKRELDDNCILACQAIPKSPLEVEVLSCAEEDFCIESVICSIDQVSESVFRIGLELEKEVGFQFGQYVNVMLPGKNIIRSYSVSWPSTGRRMVLDVALRSRGLMSSVLCDRKNMRRKLLVSKPHGSFGCSLVNDRPLMAIASGSGLGAVLGLVVQFLKRFPQQKVVLFHAVRSIAHSYDRFRLLQLGNGYEKFRHIVVTSRENVHKPGILPGRLTSYLRDWQFISELFETGLPEAKDCNLVLCGSESLIADCVQVYEDYGVVRNQIDCDVFTSPLAMAAK